MAYIHILDVYRKKYMYVCMLRCESLIKDIEVMLPGCEELKCPVCYGSFFFFPAWCSSAWLIVETVEKSFVRLFQQCHPLLLLHGTQALASVLREYSQQWSSNAQRVLLSFYFPSKFHVCFCRGKWKKSSFHQLFFFLFEKKKTPSNISNPLGGLWRDNDPQHKLFRV